MGLGGNYPNTFTVMHQTIEYFKKEKGIEGFRLSRIYRTTPVSDIPQADYLNAVCSFQTSLSLSTLFQSIQDLEQRMGKEPKLKNAPRLIDLDLLFYGDVCIQTEQYTVPHPRWEERLFVLVPLADLTDRVPIPGEVSLKERLEKFVSDQHVEVFLDA